MTKVKICGIRTEEEIDIVNEYKPDYIGFIFVEGRRRFITLEKAKELKSHLSGDIKAVGVFLDAPIEKVLEAARSGAIDMIQLHGHEDSNYVKEIKKNVDMPIIKAYNSFECADYALFDNPNPGLGYGFDWDRIESNGMKYFLAGGISSDNVLEALKRNPYAVDASSSLEGPDGFKDREKIKEFIRLVKNYEG